MYMMKQQKPNELLNELEQVSAKLPEGMHLLPSNDFVCFDGVFFVSFGLWSGLVVKFTLHLGKKSIVGRYKFDPYIRITSERKPFHPLVNPKNGKISSVIACEDISSAIQNLFNIFYYPLHQVVCKADTIKNSDALSLLSISTDEFKSKAEQDIRESYEEMSNFNFEPIKI